ncbi:MAG: hypothetical protein ACE5EE_10025 [Fidelibacterota bacterium]
MKIITTAVIAATMLFLMVSCAETTKPYKEDKDWGQTGTVEVGGFGCWMITSDNTSYEPINLFGEFQEAGLYIRFEFTLEQNMDSTCMMGPIIQIERIERL